MRYGIRSFSCFPMQRRAFVHRDVVALIALNFILRVILACMMRIALVSKVRCVRLNNLSRDVPSLRVPSNVIADFEFVRHGSSFMPTKCGGG